MSLSYTTLQPAEPPSKLETQRMGRKVVLAGLMSTWQKLESSDRREPQMRKFLQKIQL